jgi:repressor of nif and glnA expression
MSKDCSHQTHFIDTVTTIKKIVVNFNAIKKAGLENVEHISSETMRECLECGHTAKVIFR